MRILLLAAVGALALAGCSKAPQSERGPANPDGASLAVHAPNPVQAEVGLGRDEAQTLDQMMERALDRFARLDVDRNGALTKAELQTAPAGGDFAWVDTNGDGVITRGEVENQTRARFQRLDADKDGLVTREEMRAGAGVVGPLRP